MAKVLTAAAISTWRGVGCRADEHWLTLHGPKGAAQHVKLTGYALARAEAHAAREDERDRLQTANAELLTSLKDVIEYAERYRDLSDDHEGDCADSIRDALALIARAERAAPPPAPVTHEAFDQTRAEAEGWCLIESDQRGLEIQKEDEDPRFVTDGAAREHVKAWAALGSEYHRLALSLCCGGPEDAA